MRARPEDDAAYWYDLLAEDPVPEDHETRGPFEPLVSSSGPPGTASGPASGTGPPPWPRPAGDESAEAQERVRARKLEQLRDLYLTAEAIGEQNLDKHFNQLMAQQRQLISEYFGESGAARPAVASDGQPDPRPAARQAEPQSAARQAEDRPPGRDVTPPEGVAVWAEPPGTR